MSLYRGSPTPFSSHKSSDPEFLSSKKSHLTEEEIFYTNCRAAYLSVFRSSLENITSKEQLCIVLQKAGRSPSQKTIDKYWTSKTSKLQFDDFCEILKREKPLTKTELLKAFQIIDKYNSGYITHDDLRKVLSLKGEKMSQGEIHAVIELADVNSAGKFDYNKFCTLFTLTAEQCLKSSVEKLENDAKIKRQQFGSHSEKSPERFSSPASKMFSGTRWNSEEEITPREITPRKGENKSSSRPSSSRSRRASISSTISMGASSTKNSKSLEPKNLKEWQNASLKGCFYLEEEGGCINHQYRLYLSQKTTVYLTIKPFNLSQIEEKTCPWMSVDTALYVVKEKSENSQNVEPICFTEFHDKEKFYWKGELVSGIYRLLPLTTGCRLRKKKKQITGEAKLLYRNSSGDLTLTKEFRSALSDIFEVIDLDGNGLLSLEEYNYYEMRTSGEKCDEDAWDLCKKNFNTQKNELTRQGFMELNLMEAEEQEGDPSDLWVTLTSMGYNKALEMVEACPFIIDVYTEKSKPKLKVISLEQGGKLLNMAVCKSVVDKGEAKMMKGYDEVVIHTYKSDTRITSVIENKGSTEVTVHVNMEQSKNCINSRGLNSFAVEVAPKSEMVCQHVMPVNERQEWIYHCNESIVA
ncbi:EF-hand calcium-binding domain-containing protein 7 [Protopterus annectens]|uniref:EF-hand calcium-binding domain-containing protein 7 n=1 Tax=Protopterus annectens TaxID=7888 RepID=UPI001CFC3354|nr:EF-hand calcium-binding domain-containing protein 7 [Protopterus annectens]